MKYCHEQGCKQLVDSGRYCEQHRRRQRQKYKPTKNKSFYNSRAWKDLKSYCYERDGGCCTRCGKFVFGHNAQHHHIVPIRINPKLKLDPDNITTLCPTCHMIVEHGHENNKKVPYLWKF